MWKHVKKTPPKQRRDVQNSLHPIQPMASPDAESATAGGVVLVLQQLLGSSHDIATKIFSSFSLRVLNKMIWI